MTSHAVDTGAPSDPRNLSDPEGVFEAILDPGRRGDLYPYLARLRELAPRHRSSALHGRPAWILTRFDDALEVLSNKSLVGDDRNAEIFDTGPGGQAFYDMVRRLLLYVGPTAHGRIRAVVARHFTPRAVARYRPLMQKVVDGLLDRAESRGRIDRVADLAYALPTPSPSRRPARSRRDRASRAAASLRGSRQRSRHEGRPALRNRGPLLQ